jgi:hypothetical protein
MAFPLSIHGYALSSHFVYGLTAEMVRRAGPGRIVELEELQRLNFDYFLS